MSTYTVQVFRDSGQWVIEVLDVDPAGVDVVMDYSRVDPDAVSLASGAHAEQARAKELLRQAATTWREAARRLVHDDKLSVRDAAAVLGVSFGRVQQLVRDRAS